MAKEFVRNIKNAKIKGDDKEPLNTNIQNDLLSDGDDVAVRNGKEYHILTDNIKNITSKNDTIKVEKSDKNTITLEGKEVEIESKNNNLKIVKKETNEFELEVKDTIENITSKNDTIKVTKKDDKTIELEGTEVVLSSKNDNLTIDKKGTNEFELDVKDQGGGGGDVPIEYEINTLLSMDNLFKRFTLVIDIYNNIEKIDNISVKIGFKSYTPTIIDEFPNFISYSFPTEEFPDIKKDLLKYEYFHLFINNNKNDTTNIVNLKTPQIGGYFDKYIKPIISHDIKISKEENEIVINGNILVDYDYSQWIGNELFKINNITVQYVRSEFSSQMANTLGNIDITTEKFKYEFEIRVNDTGNIFNEIVNTNGLLRFSFAIKPNDMLPNNYLGNFIIQYLQCEVIS